ncbi:hypothetical protein DITRI_Ditri16bG0054600 [Diplodiscus trichospermus]
MDKYKDILGCFNCRRILERRDRNPHKVVIDNGLVEITIENPSGYLIGIKHKGVDNVLETKNENKNKGYWDVVWDRGVDQIRAKHVKVITQTDDMVELSFTKTWNVTTDLDKTVPLNIDKRFIVRRAVSGVYMYSILEHKEDFPETSLHHIRIAFKLKQDRFQFMVLSDTRQRIMPSGPAGDSLAYKEAVLLTNPSETELRGEIDDKYQYATENKDNKLHGWISDAHAVGFWIITPSDEFRIGGPNKQGLTSHPGSTALSIFVTSHYAGQDMDTKYKKGEYWKKVFGPVLIYINSASQDDHRKTLWNDAKRQLSEEIESWPYNFTRSDDYPHADQRGKVLGQLLVRDRFGRKGLVQAKSAFVGLAPPGDVGSWQRNGKGYQFWTQTDDHGRFNIKNVRPGQYNLYAWVKGFIGDYRLGLNITIQPGSVIYLDSLIYFPPRNGPTLWEIGVPDRTAAEFYVPEPYPTLVNSLCLDDADTYKQYGLWERYSDIHRHSDLVYTVGTSNYSRDWFYAHVVRNIGNSKNRPTTWQIKYNLRYVNERGNYTLRLALAAASYAELQKGNNTIFLTQTRSNSAYCAVLYDYIRLEGPSV